MCQARELLKPLPEDAAHGIFMLAACLDLSREKKWSGGLFHRMAGRWLESGSPASPADLDLWCKEHVPWARRFLDRAVKQAELRRREGIGVVCWNAGAASDGSPGMDGSAGRETCPRVMFTRGDLSSACCRPWAAIFNSRKPRLISPRDDWVMALRTALRLAASAEGALAASVGTVTYDMTVHFALGASLPLLLILPFPLNDPAGQTPGLRVDDALPPFLLSCQIGSADCGKAARMVCRDRLLASLADVHYLLEIRSDGNLLKLLLEQHTARPRPLRVFQPARQSTATEGSLRILSHFPQRAARFKADDSAPSPRGPGPAASAKAHSPALVKLWEIPVGDYLYHYTRSCPGPWPGQSYDDYLESLLQDEPLSGHTALDTLARLLTEGCVRAGGKMVKGGEAVVSWTARSPIELQSIRRWSPALIRWTFEPYGLAVSRKRLKHLGARPSIYAKSEVYSRLKPEDRFRFQKHEPPHCSWKHEREWRLPKDFPLAEASNGEGFVFVATHEDAARLDQHRGAWLAALPVLVLAPSCDGPEAKGRTSR